MVLRAGLGGFEKLIYASASRRPLASVRMLRMLVLKDHFLAKIRPAISSDIHDNIIGGRQSRPQKPLAAATFVFSIILS